MQAHVTPSPVALAQSPIYDLSFSTPTEAFVTIFSCEDPPIGSVLRAQPAENNAAALPPLVVDLDGTLTPTDTLVESVIQVIKQSIFNLFKLPIWMLQGRAAFKREVASRAQVSGALLPYRNEFLAYLRAQKSSGRAVILATAADKSIADDVANHLALFDAVLASSKHRNLKGKAKLEEIRAVVGDKFVYAGDSSADLPIWQASEAAIPVGTRAKLAHSLRQMVPIEAEFPKENISLQAWTKAMRVHQWLKNLLIFVPLITTFSLIQPSHLLASMVAFLAFSFSASATYIVNDLWDLQSDRKHPRKRLRPFASARLPITYGLAAAAILLLCGAGLSLCVSKAFAAMLASYVILTSLYSWVLKEYVLIDVIMLSVLYTLRIFAGSVAINVSTSSWLLAFSVFIFLSLALVKRCSELVSLDQSGSTVTAGRDYRVSDLAILWPLGVGSALCSIVIFGLFTSAAETQARYSTPALLWLVAIGLIYWLARLWIKTSRGEMHDDPLVYAIKDAGSRITVMTIITTMLLSQFFPIEAFL
jgi:4-hydroxybenzoate polyprenyltransferase